MNDKMTLGFIGLGKMGKNMVLRLLEGGVTVVAWNRSPEPLQEVVKKGALEAKDLADLVNKLTPPRVIWLMLPAGPLVSEFIDRLVPLLKKNDLIIDGGNSFYQDSLKRAKRLFKKGIHFMDIGTSGGPGGARTGACLMIGGNNKDFKRVKKIARILAAPGAYQHLGPVGAGHFAKMVHNGIEYGMMEALAEGVTILKHSPFKYDFVKLLRLYNHRSVIESRLVGWLKEAFVEDRNLEKISSVIGSTGEGEWTVKEARIRGIKTPVLKDAVRVRQVSAKDKEESPEGFRNKVVSAMRGQFGGHAVKKI